MSDVSPSRRLLESWLKENNTPIFSQDIIKDAHNRAQKLPGFLMRALSSRSGVKSASSPKPCKNTSSLNRIMLWNYTKSVEILKVENIMVTKQVSPAALNDVTTADPIDVILEELQIPKVWQVTPGQLTTQISQHKLDLLAKRIKDLIETLVMQPYTCDSSILAMIVDKLSKAQRTTTLLQSTLEAERQQTKSTHNALQKHIDELESSVEDHKQQNESSQHALQKRVDELESSLEDERCASRQAREDLDSHLSKRVQTSGTQTESGISFSSSSSPQEVDQSPAVREEIFYDTLATIDQSNVSSEEIFYDAVSTFDDVTSYELTYHSASLVARDSIDQSPSSSEEIFYDALSTSSEDSSSCELTFHSALSVARDSIDQSGASSEEIFYDALLTIPSGNLMKDYETASTSLASLGPVDSLDKAIMLANSDLVVSRKTTPKSRGKAAVGTIVRSKDDLIPFRESKKTIRLGSGAAGTVYLHRHAKTNEPVALKVVHIPPKEGDIYGKRIAAIEKLQNEMRILKRLGRMEWFPEFYGCYKLGKDVIGIAMEFCGDVAKGESYSILNCMDGKGPKLDKDSWLNVMLDVVDGLRVMHRKGYLCNDLKEDNVLLEESEGEWRAKIIDFGWSSDISKPSVMPFSARQKRSYKYRQMFNYIAPECALKRQPFSVSSDVYSLGRLAAFLGQEMPCLKELGEYGFYVYSCQPSKRPSLRKFSQEITYLRCATDNSDSDEDSV